MTNQTCEQTIAKEKDRLSESLVEAKLECAFNAPVSDVNESNARESNASESDAPTSDACASEAPASEVPESDAAASEEPASRLTAHELGKRGERAAVRYLEYRGYEILERNWSCFAGEADIIAFDNDVLCFIEVKTRRGLEKGFPAEAVTRAKRTRYENIAACYLHDHNYCDIAIRFDIVSLVVLDDHRAFLRLHTNAFSAGE